MTPQPSQPGWRPRNARSVVLRVLAVAALAGCGRDAGVPDSELGDLVVARPTRDQPIDVELAARDADELGRAVALPHTRLGELLGPHRLTAKSQLEVADPGQGGKVVEQLGDETVLQFAGAKAWRGVMNNSADYGREVIALGDKLYLRARYQRWHERPPNDEREPDSLRDGFAQSAAATWDLLAPAIAVTDAGQGSFAGRAARKLGLGQASTPRATPREALAQRKWRESRSITDVQGEVMLDAKTGAALAVSLRGTVSFQREGHPLTMKLSVESQLGELGAAQAPTPPPAEDVVQTPGRLHEVDERDRLLEGIAPPLRGGDRRGGAKPSLTPPSPPATAPTPTAPAAGAAPSPP